VHRIDEAPESDAVPRRHRKKGLKERLLHLVALVASPLVRLLSLVVVLDKTIWVFGFRDELRENSKYLFLDLSNRHRATVRPVWLSMNKQLARKLRDSGYEAHYVLSLAGIRVALKAGCDFSHTGFVRGEVRKTVVGCGRAVRIDLWHGIPMKRIRESDYADYAIATSESTRDLFSRSLGVPPAKVLVCGYPRSDILLREIKGCEMELEPLMRRVRTLTKSSRILLYAPTFRDSIRRSNVETMLGYVAFDAKRLDGLLKSHDAYLFVKLHHFVASGEDKKKSREEPLDTITERIHLVKDAVDVYPILRLVDVLVTDYSSIYFDFLLLDKPIVFYIPDYQEYQKTTGFSLDYDSMTPGPKARSFEELLAALGAVLKGDDSFVADRKRVREHMFSYFDGNSSDRVFLEVAKILNLQVRETSPAGHAVKEW
jgi:CDP-glycerol glycerophosphotransferase (TagB/SpsB family)